LNFSLLFSFKCGHDKIKKAPKILNDSIIKNDSTRRLDDSYHPISFFVDYTQINYDGYGTSEYINFIKNSIDSTLEVFSNLIKVKRSKKLIFSQPIKCTKEITRYDNSLVKGVDVDIVLIPIIDPDLDDEVDAAASACYLDGEDQRPVMGYVLLNQNYAYQKSNAQEFLTMLLLHEITHVLVFSDSLYEYFQYYDVTTTKTVNGVTRTLIQTPKVLEVAAQHFGCSSIDGVEIENQGGVGSAGSHWEARIMLGDYMISTDYPEIVISDISLALFEDSGWYKVNYYTGGLFRFGKGQGCSFLNSKCVSSEESNFFLGFL
jgi:leishmanolysin